MKTQQQRAQALRDEKLASIREQVEKGSLVIRQMTPEEHASCRASARSGVRGPASVTARASTQRRPRRPGSR